MRIRRSLIVPAAVLGLATVAATAVVSADAQAFAGSKPAAASASVTSPAPLDFSAIATSWSTEKGGLDIGYLKDVKTVDGVVKVTIDRVSFYTGPEAKALNRGKEPLNSYTMVDLSTKQRTFVLDPKASLQAEYSLRNDTAAHPEEGGDVGRQKLTMAQFLRNAAVDHTFSGGSTLVWLRHTDGNTMTGNVTALAEQYVP